MSGWRWLMFGVLVAALVACDESLTGPSVPLDQTFTLAPGDVVSIDDTAARVQFHGVEGDSRCPADVVCIQGGDAVVRVSVSADGARRDYELHTSSMAPVTHDGLTIALVELAPYPFSSRTIAPGDYRATLRVTR
jgi:hypothetical protein